MNISIIVGVVISALIALSVTTPVLANNPFAEIQAKFRADIKEAREERKESKHSFLGKFFNMQDRIVIKSGTVTAKNDTTLTITKDSTTYIVETEDDTKFRRKFWGKSDLDEVSVGNLVNVIGRWTDDTHTKILAHHVRNLSIQKRFGVFFGLVKSLSADGWVMSTVSSKRLDQTVTVSAETQFTNRKEEIISKTDVQVGHKVRVKGLWDSSANTVTEVTKVKDFTLPVKVSPTVTATPTAAP